MSRHGDPTGWRRYWDDVVVVAVALYEEGRAALWRARRRCSVCGRRGAGRSPISGGWRCRAHLQTKTR